ncbi:acetyltransferase [Aliiglaciecola sp. CAU 1673]|nr:acetyltransferase [Aliiglaciecola sp. CAU 1673]
MESKKLVIIGAGGHGKVAADCAEQQGGFSSIIFLDQGGSEHKDYPWPILDKPENFARFIDGNSSFFVAIGHNASRDRWTQALIAGNAPLATLIHPTAVISAHSQIGAGTLVCARAVVNPFTSIGISCIVNTSAIIEHDCKVNDLVHVAPGSCLAGNVEVGRASFIGIGTSIVPGIKLGANVQIGAGAAVTKDIKDNCLAVGVPARIIKSLPSC